ncbi:LemA family protein [Dysgonomonas sp. ZJ709]|uniref:LemA family protein n=1 Tax=Dysgonomonas sp. ZJ709 TaxID=2709797 RepID=UPI0013EC73A4|nr:LemA family protein [Dysgonomonas sp. ZJ709]
MKSKSTLVTVAVIIGIIVIGLLIGSSSYNGMVQKEESVTSQWAQVQNAYQRRADLIPNLVSTVKGYAAHEQGTLEAVVEARAKATQLQVNADQLTEENLKKYQEAQGQLGSALGRLLAVQENYPDLKANTNFLALQDELAGTENRISTERKRFNDTVQEYNQSIRKFPRNIIASILGFEKKAYFAADAASQSAPKVEF